MSTTKHIIGDLVHALPARTIDVTRNLRHETGLNRIKVYRIITDPYYPLNAVDAIKIAEFFKVTPEEFYKSRRYVPELVEKVKLRRPEILRHTKPFKQKQ